MTAGHCVLLNQQLRKKGNNIENDKKSLSWTWILSQGEEPRTKDWQMLFEYLAATKWL